MVNAMSAHYGTIRICSYRNRTQCDLELEPGTNHTRDWVAVRTEPCELIEIWFIEFRFNNDSDEKC